MDDSHSSAARALPLKMEAPKPKAERETAPLLQAMRGWLRHALGSRPDTSLKEALEEAIEEHEEQAEERLAPEERIMLHNVLSFGEIQVSDIMVPRSDIAAVSHDIEWGELAAHIETMRHTRIPVYEDTLDKMVGFIHVKDLLPVFSAGSNGFKLSRVLRPLLFVPPSMRVIDLLVMMRQAGSHMAIVVDEYGGTDGLVTMEDVFEELVGDIQDEHDDEEDTDDKVHRISDTTVEVSARIPVENLEAELGMSLDTGEEGDYDTLGGLIFFQLGRVPVRGEIVRHATGIRFEITEADPRRIRRVRVLTAAPAA